MAVTRASFLEAFPEFDHSGDTLIDATLARVELDVSDAFGDKRDRVVMLKLAHALALSPAGRDARMLAKGVDNVFVTTYWHEYTRLTEANAVSASRFGSRGC